MKRLILASLCLTLSAAISFAADRDVVAIKVADIHADASVLNGQQHVSTGQPDEETLTIASGAGFVALIDLRSADEDRGIDEVAAVKAAGMQYVSLPVNGADGVTFENAAEFDRLLAEFEGPVLVHCASGNRVGALVALRASAAGASDDEALAAGKAAGLTRLEPAVAERLAEE